MSLKKESVYKKRLFWWTNPWVIALAGILILISVPMILGLATYKSLAAVIMFVITYLSLLFFVLVMVKRSLLEPNVYTDEKIIEKKRAELKLHREQVKREFLQTELEILARGQKTPVLDVWRLDRKLRYRHPFFAKIEAVVLDPALRELQIRLQIGEVAWSDQNEKSRNTFLAEMASFLLTISQDPYLSHLKRFFDSTIMEAYAMRENETGNDIPYPVFSLSTTKRALERVAGSQPAGTGDLSSLGEYRFERGGEIEPHRHIPPPIP